MPTTLDYQSPPPPRRASRRVPFWGTFALSGIVGVIFGDWAIHSWYGVRSSDLGVFVLGCLSLLVCAGILLVIRVASPSRTRSRLLALCFGLFGPLAGLVLLDIFIF